MENKNILENVYQIGVNAFEIGLPRMAVKDQNLMEIIADKNRKIESSKIFAKWIRGWDDANLKNQIMKG